MIRFFASGGSPIEQVPSTVKIRLEIGPRDAPGGDARSQPGMKPDSAREGASGSPGRCRRHPRKMPEASQRVAGGRAKRHHRTAPQGGPHPGRGASAAAPQGLHTSTTRQRLGKARDVARRLGRPFRARFAFWPATQGVALGWRRTRRGRSPFAPRRGTTSQPRATP